MEELQQVIAEFSKVSSKVIYQSTLSSELIFRISTSLDARSFAVR